MNQRFAHLVALRILADIAHLCKHLRIELADVLSRFIKYVGCLNHIVAILIVVDEIIILLHILA